jgi:pyruvate/2-oxoglutarate dehydrogenase complex dihydrolipoamide dehydrogenase (E3) component
LGTKVVHLVRSKILNFLDDDVRENLMKNMKTFGYDLRLRKNIKKIQKLENGEFQVTIVNLQDGKEYFEKAEVVLIATGRKPNTQELNLKSTDIKLN